MMLELLPVFIGIVFAQLSPGPNSMAVISLSLGSGRNAGIWASAGIASGVMIWAVLFTFGIATIFTLFPQSITFIKLLGGSYLLYLAIKTIIGTIRNRGTSRENRKMHKSDHASFLTGLLVVLTNPKAALMWIAISTFLASTGFAQTNFMLIGLASSLSAFVIYSGYAFVFSTNLVVSSYQIVSKYIDAVFGLIFGGLGAKLIIDGFRELRS